MRQTLIYAATYMVFGVGVRQNAWKLSQKLDCSENEIKDTLMEYVVPATEMFELAEETAMETPNGAESNFYENVGHTFASYCKDNGQFPEKEWMIAEMAKNLVLIFADSLSHTQKDSLSKKLLEVA